MPARCARRWATAGAGAYKITFIPQDAPLGLAHAVKISQDFLGSDRFVMFLGDNVIQGGISDLIRRFETSDWDAQVVLTPVSEPQHYGVAELDDTGCIQQAGREAAPAALQPGPGRHLHVQRADLPGRQRINPSWRGELEITDAIQWLIDHGYRVEPHVHRGWWIDTGKPIDMLEANNRVLDEIEHHVSGYVDRDSQVNGKVTIEKGAEVINSVIRGPAIIGEDTRIVNSYVGPFTSIYHDCLIEKQRDRAQHRAGKLPHRRYPRAHRRQRDRPQCDDHPLAHQAQGLQDDPGRQQPGGHPMKNLMVTGGAGFIGSNFVRYMLGKYPDYNVLVYDKLTYAGNLDNLLDVADDDPRYSFVRGDICDAAAVTEAMQAHQIDTIVNFAAETHVDRSIMDPDAFIQTDVYGTYVLLEAARRLGIERYHQISTDEVYGHIEGEHRSLETDTVAPRSPYAASKASGDLMAARLLRHLRPAGHASRAARTTSARISTRKR